MIVKRTDLMLNINEYDLLEKFLSKSTSFLNFNKEINIEIDNAEISINIFFKDNIFYFEGLKDNTLLLFYEEFPFAKSCINSINDLIGVFDFEFNLNDKDIKLFINIDIGYDGLYFDDVYVSYQKKSHALIERVNQKDLKGLYNYLIHIDFNKSLNLLLSCYILNYYISKYGCEIEISPHIKLFYEKLETIGININKIINKINKSKYELENNVAKLTNMSVLLKDRKSFDEVLYTFLALTIINTDKTRISLSIISFIEGLSEEYYKGLLLAILNRFTNPLGRMVICD